MPEAGFMPFFLTGLTRHTQSQLLTTFRKKPFKNIVGKGENASNQHFCPFPTMFSTILETIFKFSLTFVLSSANVFNFN